ncbi:MAG: MATE family efflux transporter [Gemmataceae bacterium]|nr:MATE family efflux transporter [Gemmataceae bacterium]MCI0742603.1 MATE family efflux transporter [Gemmataceae bacterium]
MDQAVAGHRLPLPSWKLVLALALPVLVQQGLVFLVNQSDRFLAGHLQAVSPREHAVLVGNVLGSASCAESTGATAIARLEVAWRLLEMAHDRQIGFQAAQTSANYVAWFISCYTILVSVGSTALVARFTGAGERALAMQVTHQSILLAIFFGLSATLAAMCGGLDLLVDLLQLRGETADLAIGFLTPLFVLLVFQVIELAGIACLVGAGDTRTGMYVMMGVAVVNLPLAWSFCLGLGPLPELGFVGIALGTALAHTLGGLTVLLVLARGRFGLCLVWAHFWPRWDLMRRLLRISIPAGVDSLSLVLGQFWFLSLVNRLGNVASSAHGIAIGWEALGYLSGAAFGTAAMTLVGQNLGAGRPDQAARSGWLALALSGGVMTFMGLVFFTLAPWMFLLFCPHEAQRPVIEAGVPVLRLVAFAMPPLSAAIIFTNALRGAGDTRVPVLFTWIGFFAVRIPLAYFLTFPELDLGPLGTWRGLDMGLYGAWLAMFADLLVRGCFFFFRFLRGQWKKQIV